MQEQDRLVAIGKEQEKEFIKFTKYVVTEGIGNIGKCHPFRKVSEQYACYCPPEKSKT